MRGILIGLFSISFLSLNAQNLVVSGVLQEENSSYKIPYATLIDITTNKYGTTSQENGSFKLVLPEGSDNNRIFISSLGFRDTTLNVSDLMKSKTLYLKPSNYLLPDVVVTSGADKEIEIGASGAKVVQTGGKTRGYESSAGFSWGAYFKTGNKDTGALLKTVNIYIGNTGFPEAPLLLRLFKFDGQFEFFRSQPRSGFRDVHAEPIIIKASQSGWIEVDLSPYSIKIPESGLYCLFTPLDKGTKYNYDTDYGMKYGASIGVYSDKASGKNIYPLFQDKDRLTVVKRANAPSPAISIIIGRSK